MLNLQISAGLPQSKKSQGKTKTFQGQGKVREFFKRSGKILKFVKVSEKSGNYILCQESIMKVTNLSDVCRNSSFDQWFSVFFIIHLANLRSVKSQGIFQLLMSGNPAVCIMLR